MPNGRHCDKRPPEAGLWILIYILKASLQELLLMIAFPCVGNLIFSSLIY
jgi:hypothetical protein